MAACSVEKSSPQALRVSRRVLAELTLKRLSFKRARVRRVYDEEQFVSIGRISGV
jgi:hypothetical protein